MKRRNSTIAAVGAFTLLFSAGNMALSAQTAPSVKRNILLKQDMAIPGHEAVMAMVELPPGSAEGKHTHPAEVYAFVQEGTITLEVEGKPATTLKAGDFFTIAPGKVHEAANHGSVPAKLLAVFVAEKGKPLTAQVQ